MKPKELSTIIKVRHTADLTALAGKTQHSFQLFVCLHNGTADPMIVFSKMNRNFVIQKPEDTKMLINIFKSKIHRVKVTQAELNYVGSITIDEDLLEAAGIRENERVQIVNNNNGERIETYAIKGKRGSGIICLNGAAARKAQPGDIVIIISYAWMTPEEAATHKPTVVFPDENNRVVK